MAYNGANLVAEFPNGPVRIWNYSTSDHIASVDDGAYFDTVDAYSKFRHGDIVQVTANDGKAIYFIEGMSDPSSVAHTKLATVSAFS